MTEESRHRPSPRETPSKPAKFEQVVLVLQGGGALGAFQAGVYQGLFEAGVEPDWVIGTSIGAINGAIIAGNEPATRMGKLQDFWSRVGDGPGLSDRWYPAAFAHALANFSTFTRGIPGFFQLNPYAAWGLQAPVGLPHASFYTTEPLRVTLSALIDFDRLNARRPRFTVGAVNVKSGDMRYFDSRQMRLAAEHVMASGALPPGFPAIRIDGEPYWDGGIYSNTPVEIVLDDKPRRNSLIFAVNVWPPQGDEPASIADALIREKEIRYASRAKSHIARQDQIHRLRHIIRELCARLPEDQRADPSVKEMAGYGCHTIMHLVRLLAPRLDGEDITKDIDFSRAGIRDRWEAGYADTQRLLAERPWEHADAPLDGVVVHEAIAR